MKADLDDRLAAWRLTESVVDVPVRHVDDTAVVVGTQTQAGTHQGRPFDGAFRVTLTFVDGALLGIHLGLRNQPGTGA